MIGILILIVYGLILYTLLYKLHENWCKELKQWKSRLLCTKCGFIQNRLRFHCEKCGGDVKFVYCRRICKHKFYNIFTWLDGEWEIE